MSKLRMALSCAPHTHAKRVGKRVRKRAHDSRTAAALHRGARKAAQLTSLCRACDRLRHS